MQVNITADQYRGQKGYAGAELELPASQLAIADALQRAHVPEKGGYQTYQFKGWPDFLFMYLMVSGDKTLEEVNLLAYKVDSMDEIQLNTYEGALLLRKNAEIDRPVSIKEMLNILYNLNSYSFYPGILNDQMLGEVCLQGEMLEEVETASDELLELLSEEKLGQCLRRRDQGEYTEKGYILCDEKTFQEVYDGKHLPEQPNVHSGLISLRLENIWNPSINRGVWLQLPAQENATQETLTLLNVTSLEDCSIAETKSILPPLSEKIFDNEDIGKLNLLAQRIEAFPEEQLLTKYKAALELETCNDLDMMLDLAENLDCYDFDLDCISTTAFGKYLLQELGVDTSDPAFAFFDFAGYGKRGLEAVGVAYTAYGSIGRNDTPFVKEFTNQPEGMAMH